MIYDIQGNTLVSAFNRNGNSLDSAYDIDGNQIFGSGVDYSKYSFTQKWASKGLTAQGFDIYDGKVFWVSRSGDGDIPSRCYVWNLSDGSQAFSAPYVTIYSGHGNNVAFDYPKVYCSPAYPPSRVFENDVSADLQTFTLNKTLTFNDGTADLDCCIDENDKTIMWTIGHISGASTTWIVSKWDLSDLTDNGDETYTPKLLHTNTTAQPTSNRYFQGIRHHDDMLWYNSGAGGSTEAIVYAIDPLTGERKYLIHTDTNIEPEGLAWVEENGEYVLYVGFQGMMMRRYTFG